MSESPNVNASYENTAAKARDSAEKSMKAGQAAAERAVKTGQDAVKTGQENAGKAFAAGSEAMTKVYDQTYGVAKEAIQKTFPQAAAHFDEVAGFQRANLEAVVAAGSAAMKSVETISSQLLAFNTQALEEGVANAQKLMACKTVPEAMEFQTQCAMAQMQQMLAHSSKIADLALKMAGEFVAPMQERLGQAAEKLGKKPAA